MKETIIVTDKLLLKINELLFDKDTEAYYKRNGNEQLIIKKRAKDSGDDVNFFPYQLVTEDWVQVDVFSEEFIKKLKS